MIISELYHYNLDSALLSQMRFKDTTSLCLLQIFPSSKRFRSSWNRFIGKSMLSKPTLEKRALSFIIDIQLNLLQKYTLFY